MIHQYKLGGYNLVLDVCSGSIHAVDDAAYDVIALFEDHDRQDVLALKPPNTRSCPPGSWPSATTRSQR